MGRRTLEDLDAADVRVETFYVCADCGTLASTNSAKRFVHQWRSEDEPRQLDRAECERLDEEEGVAVDHERGVRLTPPCPCGCDVFNTRDVLGLHYEEERTPLPRRHQ